MLSLASNISSTQAVEAKYSASFDGVDDHVEFGNVGAVKSMSMWFSPASNINSSSSATRIVGFSTSYFGVSLGASTGSLTGETLCVLPDGSSRTATSRNFTAGEWYHLVISWNASNNYFDIYVNGVAETDLVTGTHSLANWTDFKIGAAASGSNFAGKITEVALWSVTLDSNNVVALYNNDKPINATINQGNYNNSSNLIAYLKTGNGFFDDKANGIVHDQDNPGFGSNLVVNADFSTNEAEDQTYLNGGLQFDNWVEQQSSGLRKFELTSDGQGIRCTIETANDLTWNQRIYQDVSSVLTVGDVYEFSVDVLCSLARNFEACIETIGGTNDQFSPDDVALSANTRTVIKKVFRCTTTTGMLFHLYPLGDPLPAGEFYEVRNPSLKKLNGNPGLTSGGVTFSSDTP